MLCKFSEPTYLCNVFKIELKNHDFLILLYFYIVDTGKKIKYKKLAASGRWHYTVDAEKMGCGRLPAHPDIYEARLYINVYDY